MELHFIVVLLLGVFSNTIGSPVNPPAKLNIEETAIYLIQKMAEMETRFSQLESHLLTEVVQLKAMSLEAVEKVRRVEQEFTRALESERLKTHGLQLQITELTSGDVIRKNISSLTDNLRRQFNASLTYGLQNLQSNLTRRMRILENSSTKLEKNWANLSVLHDDVLELKNIVTNHSLQLCRLNQRVMDGESVSCDETVPREASDCSELLEMGHHTSGVYKIWPRKMTEYRPLEVYCDMHTDGGGWTLIQRRGNFQRAEDYFSRDWKSYEEGFGDIEKDFWLGNEYIYALTNHKNYSARFDLRDMEGHTRYALYDTFRIDKDKYKYRLHISGYTGDAGDSMEYHNNQKFSTKDQDNDEYIRGSCAQGNKAGWWFKSCHRANLNGMYLKSKRDGKGIIWETWKALESLESTEIKIRPKLFKFSHASLNMKN